MKNVLILTALLFCINVFSQTPEGFNYQAVARDASGDIIASTTIGVEFQLHETTTAGTVIYTETHSPTTNAYGVFTVVVGQGTTTNTFNTIDWATNLHFVETGIDVANGSTYVSMGTSQLLSVPYALNAKTAENVSGLEAIDEGNGVGLVKIGRTAENYGNVGENAVDLSSHEDEDSANTTYGATGDNSFATGIETTASGENSTAMGKATRALGLTSTTMGNGTNASGDFSTAMGNGTNALGLFSTAMGSNTEASGDFSIAMGNNTEATGNSSTAMGDSTEATGDNSTAMGDSTLASGVSSTAMGFSPEATGDNSTAMGFHTNATGDNSTAMGMYTKASSFASTSIGQNNIGGGTADSWVGTDPLFEIGNSSNDFVASNALTVLKNGTITAPSFDIFEITDDKALITKEYADANYVETIFSGDYNDLSNQPTIVAPTGLEAIDEANGIGLVKTGRTASNYGNIGANAVDLSYSDVANTTLGATGSLSTAMGYKTEASGENSTAIGNGSNATGSSSTAMGEYTDAAGEYSTAMGERTDATGKNAMAMGFYTEATGDYSTAIGAGTNALGDYSTAMGFSTDAVGDYSTAMGRYTNADSYAGTSIGQYNIGGGTADSWIDTDPLFEIGNGTASGSLSNVLTVLKNGTITAPSFDITEITDDKALITKEYLEANFLESDAITVLGNGRVGMGTTAPLTDLHIKQSDNGASGAGGITLENASNTDRWKIFNTSSHLGFAENDTRVAYIETSTGAYIQTSDRRLKTAIAPVNNILETVLKLKPSTYYYKRQKQDGNKEFGFIAQEVNELFPEIVSQTEDGFYGLKYDLFGVIAIKAIQEQQEKINTQEIKNKSLEVEIDILKKEIQQIKMLLKSITSEK